MRNYFWVCVILISVCIACHNRNKDICQGQVITELLTPVMGADTAEPRTWARYKIRCAGYCKRPALCDSIVELSNTPEGVPIRRVRCGCRSDAVPGECDIMIEHTYFGGDTVITTLYCNTAYRCPISSDTCKLQRIELPQETIRSVITGRDSLYVTKIVKTCECMDREEDE